LFQFQYGLIVIRAESLRLPKHNGFNSNMVWLWWTMMSMVNTSDAFQFQYGLIVMRKRQFLRDYLSRFNSNMVWLWLMCWMWLSTVFVFQFQYGLIVIFIKIICRSFNF
jgi:hypothetical protein